MYREKNKFEVLYTHRAEHNMQFALVTYCVGGNIVARGPSWSYGSRLKHYICIQCLSTLTFRSR